MPPRMFLMIFCSNVSSSSSCAYCADDAIGSASSAPQAQAIRSRRKLSPGSRSRMAMIPSCRFSAAVPRDLRRPLAANSTQSSRGIGALLRRCPPRVFIQESGHPGNDGCIREVKHVPDEIERFRSDMEQDEIDDRPISHAIDGVSEGSPDDEAERKPRQLEFRPRQPGP